MRRQRDGDRVGRIRARDVAQPTQQLGPRGVQRLVAIEPLHRVQQREPGRRADGEARRDRAVDGHDR
jgi:hypothetical protein